MALIQEHSFISKPSPLLQISTTHLPNPRKSPPASKIFAPHVPNSPKLPILMQKSPPAHLPNPCKPARFPKIPTTSVSNPRKFPILPRKEAPLCKFLQLSIPMAIASLPLPSFAAEATQSYNKINLEAVLVSIDDFFNRNPFFVAGVTFVWLVVIPLTQEYLKKYRFASAIDAFRKMRDVPEAQLLDIRKRQSVEFMAPPNLKILGKNVVQVEFDEGDDEEFLREVLGKFADPANTVVCVLDNFDGNSLKVAKLLFKNGFKEAYAIKGGLRGIEGWQAIQETYLPPSVHVYPRKNKSKELGYVVANSDMNDKQSKDEGKALASISTLQVDPTTEDGPEKPNDTASAAKPSAERPLSPYPNDHDLKQQSSPSPSKPKR